MPPRKSAARAESPARSPARTRTTRATSVSRSTRGASPVRSSSKSRAAKKEEPKKEEPVAKSASKKSSSRKTEEVVEEKPVPKKRAASKSRGRKDAEEKAVEEDEKPAPPKRRQSVRRATLDETEAAEKKAAEEEEKKAAEAPARPRRGRSRATVQEADSLTVKDVPSLNVRTRSRSGVRVTKPISPIPEVAVAEPVVAAPAFDIPMSPLQAPVVPEDVVKATPESASLVSYKEYLLPIVPITIIASFFAAAATFFPLHNLYGFVVKNLVKDLGAFFNSKCISNMALPVYRLLNPFELTFFSVITASLVFFLFRAYKPKSANGADLETLGPIFARGLLSIGVLVVSFIIFYYKHHGGKNAFFIPVMGLSIADLVLNMKKNSSARNVLLLSLTSIAYTFVFIPQTPLLNALTCNIVTAITSVYLSNVLQAATRLHDVPRPASAFHVTSAIASVSIGLFLINLVMSPVYFLHKAYVVAFEADSTKLISAAVATVTAILFNVLLMAY